ncbi:MAG TPA: type II toxin-antitoxin system Y4mF family antitoxin [Baekduia sp.]|nr:type II toxin-antitoxin system Y4mF family antitoxin [Baekduia sp.]
MLTIGSIASPEELGAAVRQARKARGLRLEDLALAAGVGTRFLSELERGKPTVRLDAVLRVLGALGLRLTLEDPRG